MLETRKRNSIFVGKSVAGAVLAALAVLTACSPAPEVTSSVAPEAIRFDGERAFQLQETMVSQFPDRHSGSRPNRAAAEWAARQMTAAGWSCQVDVWSDDYLYGEPVDLHNAVCRLQGASDQEILIVAHHDIAPTTVEGADNDAAGVAIMLHLAEIFAAEGQPAHTLTFASIDAEEYGNLGNRRLVRTHPDTRRVLAAISLDNLGRVYYDRMNIEMIGQFRGYGPIWLARAARAAARSANADWDVVLKTGLEQALDQAVPVNFMDQGTLIGAGIPAIGFTGGFPYTPAFYDRVHYACWHDPSDSMDGGNIPECAQSPGSLEDAGVVTEALVRHLLSLPARPAEVKPYLYFDDSRQLLDGPLLALPFATLVGVFLFAGAFRVRNPSIDFWPPEPAAWRQFFSHWFPLILSLLVLYAFTAGGWILYFSGYPATTKDPYLLNPPWGLIGLWLALTIAIFVAARLIAARGASPDPPTFSSRRRVAMLMIGLAGMYVFAINYFSLLFFLPVALWFLIRSRSGIGWWLDLVLFLAGGLLVYALYYQFGVLVLQYDAAFTWYLLNMFAIRMISVPTALAITAVTAAGLSLLVRPVKGRVRTG